MDKIIKERLFIFVRILFVLFILIVSVLLTLYYGKIISDTIRAATYTKLEVADLFDAGQNQNACLNIAKETSKFHESLNVIKNKTEDLSLLIKLPVNLFGYNLNIRNISDIKSENDRVVIVTFNIDLKEAFNIDKKGPYYWEIGLDEDKKIPVIINLNNFSIDKMTYSFKGIYKDDGKSVDGGTPLRVAGSIDFYLTPSFFIYPFIFFSILIILYGILSIIASYYKFIVFGKPFIEK